MISVLIPTYNYVCYKLACDLHRQLSAYGGEYEIIVAEDGSDDQETITENDKVTMLSGCVHLVRKENIGRARIINYLVREAKGEWCIVMDSDAEVVSDDYIRKYAGCMTDGADVFVGDLVNPDSLPQADATLRYKYEKAAERFRTAEFRNHHPFERFCTFNFMARRDTLLEVPFDERCTEYGYEDTLMGLELKRHGKRVSHIDNPLRHLGFDSNAVFLRKTEIALHTLKKIEGSLLPYTGMGRLVLRIRAAHLTALVKVIYRLARPLLRYNLLGNRPDLTFFSFYKLGYFLSL
ncbi:MAG: glycosyltransferase family 2 protein [Prevotella sp.]|nr:glycosyltransferase family 2 protein [Prevotella sp.]MBQ8115339.1 glycosyltransferase family 2 protein [Prevotella sp.]